MASTRLIFDIFAKDVNTKETFAGIEAAGMGVGKALGSMLGPLGIGLAGLGIADVIGHAVKAAGDFQAANTRLVTSAGESAKNLQLVGDGILQVARDTGTATEELQKGAYYIESAGFHGADMLKVLKAAAQGAKAEGSSVETVGDAVTSALRDYHLTASDAADVTSKLITATSQGKTTFELFAGSLSAVLPVASSAHISMNDILGDIASMTVHGMSADQVTQNLADTIRHMVNPTAQQASELALLGMTTNQLADDLKSKGLSGTLQEISQRILNFAPPGSDKVILDLKTALSSLPPAVQDIANKMIDGSITQKEFLKEVKDSTPQVYEQAKSLETLLGSTHKVGSEQLSGEKVLQNYTQALRLATGDATGMNTALMLTGENAAYTNNAIKAVAGATADAAGNVKGWDEIQGNFNTKLDQVKEIFQTIGIEIGTWLLPKLSDALGGFVDFYNQVSPLLPKLWENDVKPMLHDIGQLLGAVFGSGSGSGDGSSVGNAADGFGNAMTKVGTNADGTLGTGGSVAKAIADFRKSVDSFDSGIKQMTDGLNFLNGLTARVTSDLSTNWLGFNSKQDQVINDSLANVGRWAQGIMDWFSSLESWIETNFGGNWLTEGWNWGNQLLQGFVNGVEAAWNGAVSAVGSWANDVINTAKNALGIHSPSVIFHEMGLFVGQGFIDGIDASHGPVGDSMRRLANHARMSFSGMDLAPALTGGIGPVGTPSVNVYIGNEQLDARMFKVAARAIDNADFRAGRRPSL